MKIKQKIFLQANIGVDDDLSINAFSHEMTMPDYITIAIKEVEFDVPDFDIKQYKEQIELTKTKAKADKIAKLKAELKELGAK